MYNVFCSWTSSLFSLKLKLRFSHTCMYTYIRDSQLSGSLEDRAIERSYLYILARTDFHSSRFRCIEKKGGKDSIHWLPGFSPFNVAVSLSVRIYMCIFIRTNYRTGSCIIWTHSRRKMSEELIRRNLIIENWVVNAEELILATKAKLFSPLWGANSIPVRILDCQDPAVWM